MFYGSVAAYHTTARLLTAVPQLSIILLLMRGSIDYLSLKLSLNDLSASESEMDQIYAGLINIISGFYRMKMLIQKPTSHDRRIELRASDVTVSGMWSLQPMSS